MILDIEELVSAVKHKLSDYLEENDVADPKKAFCCMSPEHNDSNPSMHMYKVS